MRASIAGVRQLNCFGEKACLNADVLRTVLYNSGAGFGEHKGCRARSTRALPNVHVRLYARKASSAFIVRFPIRRFRAERLLWVGLVCVTSTALPTALCSPSKAAHAAY
jgi:hypothetical protein